MKCLVRFWGFCGIIEERSVKKQNQNSFKIRFTNDLSVIASVGPVVSPRTVASNVDWLAALTIIMPCVDGFGFRHSVFYFRLN